MPLNDLRKKLHYRAWHRGRLELELILGPFADSQLKRLDARELEEFEALLEVRDDDLYDWLSGRAEPPSQKGVLAGASAEASAGESAGESAGATGALTGALFDKIRAFHKSR